MQNKITSARLLLSRMMERSEEHLSETATNGDTHYRQVAGQLLESPHNFRRWEGIHIQLLKTIVDSGKTKQQVQGVKSMALSMIHRKAPFEYLRDKQIQGAARHQFFQMVYGAHDFATAVVNEHRNYLMAVASYICVERFCSDTSMQEIGRYERRYTSYWGAKTAHMLEDRSKSDEHSPPAVLLGELRNDLQVSRHKVLNTFPTADVRTIEDMCRPTGRTIKSRFLQQ